MIGRKGDGDKPEEQQPWDEYPEDAEETQPEEEKEPKAKKLPKAYALSAEKAPKTKKPKAEPAGIDAFGLRVGSTRSRAAALYAREEGATLEEVSAAVGKIQFNVLTKLRKEGFKITTTKEAGAKNRTVTRYRLHPK